jgi:4-amino-4-deoxy-L-arabinose transferase-like glycosyltransferase
VSEPNGPRQPAAQTDPATRTVTDASGAPLWPTRASAPPEPTPWLWLTLLTALGVVLRTIGLDGGLWHDEIATLLLSVRSPLAEIVTVFPSNNQHSLFSVLGRLSVVAFGEHAWSLRLPAMLLGAATVPVLYFFAREFVGRAEALLASLLLTVAYHHVWFSQNARGYSALAFLTIASSWLLLRGLRRGRPGDFVWYAIVAALGVYAHLTMVFLVISHALLCLMPLGLPLDAASRARWRWPATGFALAAAVTMLLYSPVLFDMQQFFTKVSSGREVATPRWAALELLRGLRIGLGATIGALAGITLLVAGLWSYFKQSRFLLALFIVPAVVTIAGTLAMRRPIFPRFLFFLVGFALLIIVRGALEIGGRLQRRHPTSAAGLPAAGVVIILVMVALSTAALVPNYRYPKQDFAGAMDFVLRQHGPDEPIVTTGPATYIYQQYHKQPWPEITSRAQFDALRAQGRRVWVVYTLEGYIQSRSPDLLAALHTECAVQGVFRGTVGNGDITVCAAPPGAPSRRP